MAKLMLFTGKGGVGKSTTSGAMAAHWASEGYKTLLVSSDPAHSTEDVVGVPVTFTPTLIRNNLWAKNINAKARADEFISQMNVGLDSTFAKWFPGFDSEILSDWAAFPGMDEVFALEELMHLVQGVDYDIIVFDTAPTGHTLKALTAPEAINKFLLRILRMKSRIESMKGIFIRKNKHDVSQLVNLLEQTTEMVNNLKRLLRMEEFVSINLVSIPTEAGYQECVKTIRFLKSQEFKVHNLVLNNIIPKFDDKTWELASSNKAVALMKCEKDIQQPYMSQYSTLAEQEGITLVGVSKLPFEPRADKLLEFSKFLKGLNFIPENSIVVEDSTDSLRVILKFPHIGKVTLGDNHYMIDGFKYPLNFPNKVVGLKPKKRKTSKGANYTFKL